VVTLTVTSPSPILDVSLTPTVIDPSEQATLTVVDEHYGTRLVPGLWYSLPILGSSGGITSTLEVNLLVGGTRFCLPMVRMESP
jgi:hypothetical protein